MPVVFVKDPHLNSRQDVKVEDLKATSVSSFKTDIARKKGVGTDEIMLMYGGRVLKHSRTLTEYNIVDGVTIFCMKKKEPREFSSERVAQTRAMEQLRTLIRNPRIFKILSRLVANPSLLESLLKDSVIYNNPAIQKLLQDSEIRACAGDPESLIRAFEARPEEAVVVNDILGVLGAAVEDCSELTGYEAEHVEGELVEMMDRSVEDGTEFLGEENQASVQRQGLADTQDQMFQHSQAILAHHQSQSTSSATQQPESMETSSEATPPQPQQPPPPYESLMNLSRQASTGSGSGSSGITQDMLASALSTLQYPHPVSPSSSGPSSLSSSSNLQPPRLSHSGPSSLPSQLPPAGEEQLSFSTSPSSSLPVRSSSIPFTGITQEDLMQALQNITQQVPADQSQPSSSSSSSTHRSRHRHRHSHRAERQHRYQKQLQQLKSMGLSDEAAVLHALEATKGDIDAALELLIGTGKF